MRSHASDVVETGKTKNDNNPIVNIMADHNCTFANRRLRDTLQRYRKMHQSTAILSSTIVSNVR